MTATRRRHPGLPARHAQGVFREGPCRFPGLPRRSRGRGIDHGALQPNHRLFLRPASIQVQVAWVHGASSGHSTCARTLSSAPTSARSRTNMDPGRPSFARGRCSVATLWSGCVCGSGLFFTRSRHSWNLAFVRSGPRFIGRSTTGGRTRCATRCWRACAGARPLSTSRFRSAAKAIPISMTP